MAQTQTDIQTVLCFSGLDPTGGAGIQADMETISSMGCHCLPIITANTVQDTHNVSAVEALDAHFIQRQLQTLAEDITINAIKIGMPGSIDTIAIIAEFLSRNPDIPVVLDPIITAGGGTALSSTDSLETLKTRLLPHVTVLTPNSIEARELCRQNDLAACARQLRELGCRYVLISGGHEPGDDIINHLYGSNALYQRFEWPRLPYQCHGTGCTLSAAIAALLAKKLHVVNALEEAQEYTWQTVRYSRQIGEGQRIPYRFYWAHHNEEE